MAGMNFRTTGWDADANLLLLSQPATPGGGATFLGSFPVGAGGAVNLTGLSTGLLYIAIGDNTNRRATIYRGPNEPTRLEPIRRRRR